MAATKRVEVPIPEGMIGFTRAAEIIGCSRVAIHAMRRRGELHAIEANGQWWTTPIEAKTVAERKYPRSRPRKGQVQQAVLDAGVTQFLEADQTAELVGA